VPLPPHTPLESYYGREDERARFVTDLFDGGARHYNRLGVFMAFGSGSWYRRWALKRAGLRPHMRVLDVATGTGLVARAAVKVVGDPRAVVGLDASEGMLREARKSLTGPLVRGQGERVPFASGAFDFVTIGFALRHFADLDVAFREFQRVLKPGGRLLVLEILSGSSPFRRRMLRTYLMHVLPALMTLTTRSPHPRVLSRYYWDTIDACVPPAVIMDSLRRSGFARVDQRVFGGFACEYLAVTPSSADRHLGGGDAAKPVARQQA
jgi:demethylmenaquinone methyltransferase / 2-methoxy-6-polyprenyl-1,4-benzoquinol methylase